MTTYRLPNEYPPGTRFEGEGHCMECGMEILHGMPWALRSRKNPDGSHRSGMACQHCAFRIDDERDGLLSLFIPEHLIGTVNSWLFFGAIGAAAVLYVILRLLGQID